MKYFFASLGLVLLTQSTSTSFNLTGQKTVPDILQIIAGAKFTYQGKAIMSGYFSTESCLYTSDEIAVLIDYCGQSKDYPARSITILSRDFGLLQFYEEKVDQSYYRAIRLQLFNGELKPVLPVRSKDITLKHADQSYELSSDIRLPACWSLNRASGDGCHAFDVNEMAEWHSANKIYFNSQSDWNQLFSQILARLPL